MKGRVADADGTGKSLGLTSTTSGTLAYTVAEVFRIAVSVAAVEGCIACCEMAGEVLLTVVRSGPRRDPGK